jgi:hypothetical protein
MKRAGGYPSFIILDLLCASFPDNKVVVIVAVASEENLSTKRLVGPLARKPTKQKIIC